MPRPLTVQLLLAVLVLPGPARGEQPAVQGPAGKACRALSDCPKDQACLVARGKPQGSCVSAQAARRMRAGGPCPSGSCPAEYSCWTVHMPLPPGLTAKLPPGPRAAKLRKRGMAQESCFLTRQVKLAKAGKLPETTACDAELKDLKIYCRADLDCASGEVCRGCFPDPCSPQKQTCRTRCVKKSQRKAPAAKGKTCDPDREDHRRYSGRDPASCRKKQPPCPKGSVPFQNACGCGCAQPQSCPKYVNCMPGPGRTAPCRVPAECPLTSVAY